MIDRQPDAVAQRVAHIKQKAAEELPDWKDWEARYFRDEAIWLLEKLEAAKQQAAKMETGLRIIADLRSWAAHPDAIPVKVTNLAQAVLDLAAPREE